MPLPLAYFLTWTTKGTWLHGDQRGSADATHNTPGTPYLPEDKLRHSQSESMLRESPIVLSVEARALVASVIEEHCNFRAWKLHALNVRSNHVHIVVTCPERVTPEDAMSQFKAWTTRRLREAGHVKPDQKPWTEHGSTRWIDSESSLRKATDYILNHQ